MGETQITDVAVANALGPVLRRFSDEMQAHVQSGFGGVVLPNQEYKEPSLKERLEIVRTARGLQDKERNGEKLTDQEKLMVKLVQKAEHEVAAASHQASASEHQTNMPESTNNPTNLYHNRQLVTRLIDAMQTQRSLGFTAGERETLLSKPALAERVFNGGLRELIITEHVSIGELAHMSQGAVSLLTFSSMHNAVQDGAISAAQFGALTPDKLKELTSLIERDNFNNNTAQGRANFDRVSSILGLNDDQSRQALRHSLDNTETSLRQRQPQLGSLVPSAPMIANNPQGGVPGVGGGGDRDC